MKINTINTKVRMGTKINLDGTQEDNYHDIKRIVLFDPDNRYFIVCECDFCHIIYDSKKNESIEHCQYMGSEVIPDMPFDEFMSKLVFEDIDIKKWAHSFGIKDRIRSNYSLFLKNCKQLGIITDEFPYWGR